MNRAKHLPELYYLFVLWKNKGDTFTGPACQLGILTVM